MVHLQPFANTTVAALAQIAIKSSGLILIAAGINGLLRRRTAALRHIVWTAALASVLMIALFGSLLPAWKVIHLPQRFAAVLPAATLATTTVTAAEVTPAPVTVAPPRRQVAETRRRAGLPSATTVTSNQSAAPITPKPPDNPTPVAPQISWRLWVGLFWIVGAAAILGRYIVASIHVRYLLTRSQRVLAYEWTVLENRVSRALGITRPVMLLTSERVDVPITCGVVYPRVVLPVAADQWTPMRRRAVLSHELAHVKRFDAATQWIALASTVVGWFNPLVWYAVRQMRFERERACDDFVLASGARASEYASDLLDIVSSFGNSEKYHVALAMARRSQFEGRLLALLDPALDHKFLSRRALATVTVLTLAVVLPVAAARLAQEPAQQQPSSSSVTAQATQPVVDTINLRDQHSQQGSSQVSSSITLQDQDTQTDASRQVEQSSPAPAPPAPPATPASPSTSEMLRRAPAAPAPPATAPAPAAATHSFNSGQFAPCENAKQRIISRHEDGSGKRWDVTVRGDNCDVTMRAEGDVRFKPDFSGVESLSSGGYLTIKSSLRGETNDLDVRPTSSGLTYAYSRNGSRMQMDAAAQEWLKNFLVELDRSTAFAVDSRLPQLLAQGGPSRVLQETASMADYARSVYIAELMKRAQLSPTDAREVIRQAAATTSDYYSAQMLMAISDKFSLDDKNIGDPFVAAIDHLQSDYYHEQVLLRFLDKSQSISRSQADALLRSATHIKSDYYLTEVLQHMVERHLIAQNGWPSYLDAAQKIESDYYRSQVLRSVMTSYSGDPVIVERGLLAAEKINSDYYKLEVLRAAKDRFKIEGGVRDAYLRVARTIQSDTYRNQALAGLVSSGVL